MQPSGDELSVERISAERPRYTSSILLLPGLFCRAAVWHRMMGYLAHRGWECAAVAASPALPSLSVYAQALQRRLAAYESPPIVIGHDLGAALALYSSPHARAVVGLNPLLLQQPNHLWMGLAERLSLWRGRELRPRPGRIRRYFGSDPPGGPLAIQADVVREIAGLPRAATPTVPSLLLAGEHDPVSPPSEVSRLGREWRAEVEIVAGAGHALPWEPGWDARVGELHRWIIRTLGEALLIPEEED